VLTFLTAGVLFDISSTTMMIIGARKIPITIHGFIGYSALAAMLIDTILIWLFWRGNGGNQVPKGLNIYILASLMAGGLSLTLQERSLQ
jgi:hypothetical protein